MRFAIKFDCGRQFEKVVYDFISISNSVGHIHAGRFYFWDPFFFFNINNHCLINPKTICKRLKEYYLFYKFCI